MLEFLGTGSAFNNKKGNNAAFKKIDNRVFMIDCGSDVFSKIKENDFTKGINEFEIFITHTHGDHVGSLGDFVFYTYFCVEPILNPKTIIYSVKDSNVKEVLDLMGCFEEIHYRKEYIGSEKEVMDGEIKIKPFRTKHYKKMNSYGLEIEMENKKILYSSDANAESYEYIDFKKYDLMYLDVSQSEKAEAVHMSMRQLLEMTKNTERNKIVCMHLDEIFDEQQAKENGFLVAKSIYEKGAN